MSVQYNADEIFEMAEEIEGNGAKFYRAAEERFDETETRALVHLLGDHELQHLRLFRRLRRDLAKRTDVPDVFDPTGEAQAYLRAAADSHVFRVHASLDELLAGIHTPRGILDQALSFEKDSVAFYTAMVDVVPETLGRDSVRRLLAAEQKHVRWVQQLIDKQATAGT